MTSWNIIYATRVLHAGGVLAYPTEAVYGLGCRICELDAVDNLAELKGRPADKGYIIIAAEPAQLRSLFSLAAQARRQEILASWPGPVTWIVPARSTVPDSLCGPGRTVAVRVTGHPLAAELCSRVGPIVSTSANPAGRLPARTPGQVKEYFRLGVDYVLEGPLGGALRPSQLRDARTGRVLRTN